MIRLSMTQVLLTTALAAGAADVEWKWDTSGRIPPEDPVVRSGICQTTFDSRLYAKAVANPASDELQKFDSRPFMSLTSEGINFNSTKTGMFLVIR